MKWALLMLAAVMGTRALADGPTTKPNDVDPEVYRRAVERLAAKAPSQQPELEQLRKENAALREELAKLRQQLKELLGSKADDESKTTAGVFEFSWREGGGSVPGSMGVIFSQRFRAATLADAITKAKAAGVPVIIMRGPNGEESYPGARKLSDAEASKMKGDIGAPFMNDPNAGKPGMKRGGY